MTDVPVIRRAGPDDAAGIKQLTRQAYAPWVELVGREPLPMTADYAVAVRDHLIDLAHCEGELCGVIEMVVEPDHLLIKNLAVSPNHQGRGLGTVLLHRAEVQAEHIGLPTLRLYTNRAFGSNVSFYERHGFAVERTEAFMGGWTVHMFKSVGE